MRVLVSGVTGFTGQHIGGLLKEKGHQVFGLKSRLLDFTVLEKELAVIRPEAIIHLAGIAFVAHKNKNDFYGVNVIGTRNLLEAITHTNHKVQSVLISSSANVYGNALNNVITESDPVKPVNDYAVSKYAMELVCSLWTGKLPITIARPFNYTGKGQSENFVIPKIISHFKHRKASIELGNIDVSREFNDVRFVADAYVKIIEKSTEVSGKVINICTGNTYCLKDVIHLCEELTGHRIHVSVNQKLVRQNEVTMLKGDNGLLKRLIGVPVHYHLKDTIQWMLS